MGLLVVRIYTAIFGIPIRMLWLVKTKVLKKETAFVFWHYEHLYRSVGTHLSDSMITKRTITQDDRTSCRRNYGDKEITNVLS
jgi:hypothetical protein